MRVAERHDHPCVKTELADESKVRIVTGDLCEELVRHIVDELRLAGANDQSGAMVSAGVVRIVLGEAASKGNLRRILVRNRERANRAPAIRQSDAAPVCELGHDHVGHLLQGVLVSPARTPETSDARATK